MNLAESYAVISPCIVEFVETYGARTPSRHGPSQPCIIGTGYVVHERGIVATNAHVIEAISKVDRPADLPKDEFPVHARLHTYLPSYGHATVSIPILGTWDLCGFRAMGVYYGPSQGPDLAMVAVAAHGLPAVTLDHTTTVVPGMPIAVAGYPMGHHLLTNPEGFIAQLGPTLRAGIISATLPFPGSSPHAYTIDVVSHGGASGSPVFLQETAGVIGTLYAGLAINDTPTNVTYVVPSHYLHAVIDSVSPALESREYTAVPQFADLVSTIPNYPQQHGSARVIAKADDPPATSFVTPPRRNWTFEVSPYDFVRRRSTPIIPHTDPTAPPAPPTGGTSGPVPQTPSAPPEGLG